MRRAIIFGAAIFAFTFTVSGLGAPLRAGTVPFAATPVIDWSTEARRAIVPAGPGGIFGSENYGNKFPGEAAIYMGIVHVAIYDAAVAIEGGYEPYAAHVTAPPDTSRAAAIATAAHDVLVGLQPALGLSAAQEAILDGDYQTYLSAIPDGASKLDGVAVGRQVAAAVLALRQDDGRDKNPSLDDLDPPAPGAGIWEPDPTRPVLGLRIPGIRTLALTSASQLRPVGPNPLTSDAYTQDFDQVASLGRLDSSTRTDAQTTDALFWTDNDIRQWNDGMLRLAAANGLDLVQTARMLAMAHVSGGDAMIACFDAKFHYWSWRPDHAIPHAGIDGNPATQADPSWLPLRPTPNFPEYPSAHACHSSAVATALQTFFGTDKTDLTLDSRVTGTTRRYGRFHDVVKEVDIARVLAGFHFRNSDLEGATLGRTVARSATQNLFQPSERSG
jgi:hypothetical protein